jgi:hypothetical protein
VGKYLCHGATLNTTTAMLHLVAPLLLSMGSVLKLQSDDTRVINFEDSTGNLVSSVTSNATHLVLTHTSGDVVINGVSFAELVNAVRTMQAQLTESPPISPPPPLSPPPPSSPQFGLTASHPAASCAGSHHALHNTSGLTHVQFGGNTFQAWCDADGWMLLMTNEVPASLSNTDTIWDGTSTQNLGFTFNGTDLSMADLNSVIGNVPFSEMRIDLDHGTGSYVDATLSFPTTSTFAAKKAEGEGPTSSTDGGSWGWSRSTTACSTAFSCLFCKTSAGAYGDTYAYGLAVRSGPGNCGQSQCGSTCKSGCNSAFTTVTNTWVPLGFSGHRAQSARCGFVAFIR